MKNDGLQEKIEISIAYIGGGSRGWAWDLMGDLALEKHLCGSVRLYDIDFAAAKANEKIGNSLLQLPENAGTWTYEAKESLRDALDGADFVVISILPGTFDEMEADLLLPQQYGIYQSVGDTVGPGGVLRSMRTVPMYVEIAEGIRAYCPDAWVINYTNPMSVCTGALYRVFPGIKAFGCCHEVFSTQELFAKMLETERGVEGVRREEIALNVLGLNHFTWFSRASWRTEDLLPLYSECAEKYAESGYTADPDGLTPQNYFRSLNKVGFDLFRRFHIVPLSGDRHIAEFLPPWYLRDPDTVEQRWGFRLTPVSWRKQEQKRLLADSRAYASGEKRFVIKASGEEGVRLMRALTGLGDFVTNVNLPNLGQMRGLPLGAIVETNALVRKDSVGPVFAGELPPPLNAIVLRHAVNQQNLVAAGVEKDIGRAFGAFLNDPLMGLDIHEAERLFGEMVRATASYLEGYDLSLFTR